MKSAHMLLAALAMLGADVYEPPPTPPNLSAGSLGTIGYAWGSACTWPRGRSPGTRAKRRWKQHRRMGR